MKKSIVLAIPRDRNARSCAGRRWRACEKLKSFEMQDVVIDSAAPERSGSFTTSLGPVLNNLPAFCRVVGHATPTPQSRIGFEVWLPEKN